MLVRKRERRAVARSEKLVLALGPAAPYRPDCMDDVLPLRRYPGVILAEPVSHPPSVSHSRLSSSPAARWIAPSTPPPPRRVRFAALTMASTSRVVMSATQMSSLVEPILAV